MHSVTFALLHSLFFTNGICRFSIVAHKSLWRPPSQLLSVQAVLMNVLSPDHILHLRNPPTYTQPAAQDKWYAYSDLDRISLVNFSISTWDFLTFWGRWSAFFEFHLDVFAWASFYAVWKEMRGSQHLQVL